MLFINFKNYNQAFKGFPKIYQDLEKTALKYPQVATIFAPPPLLFTKVAKFAKLPLWAQHLDPFPFGPYTGYLPAIAIKTLGASGTFLNHSERSLSSTEIKKAVVVAKEISLPILIFATTLEAIIEIKNFSPNYIAYEPPELIGAGVSRGVSVASAQAETIPKAVEAAKPTPLLIGAGIHKREDIETGLRLGALGGVVSSAIVTASQPTVILDKLLSAF